MNEIDTVIVGGGPAGIAMSKHLSDWGVPHVVLERGRVAERWRSGRWDSMLANGPAWHDRFPDFEFSGIDPDSYVPKEQVADYFVRYAKKFHAPIATGVNVECVTRNVSSSGFTVKTSEGTTEARRVVAATGSFQKPFVPLTIPPNIRVTQVHTYEYKNPTQLPNGAVLVVGCGSSGSQIADELQRCGRRVYLSIGRHERPPRAYRGLSFGWWMNALGKWDIETFPEAEHVTIAVSGSHETIDFRKFAEKGMTLVGRLNTFSGGDIVFNNDLIENLRLGDASYISLLKAADHYAVANALDLPRELEAHVIPPDPECVKRPILTLNVERAGITSIIWATGYLVDFGWLEVTVFDQKHRPQHKRGVSTESGLYFVGLPFLSNRSSSFIWGVWHDAKYIAEHIARCRRYEEYYARKIPQDVVHDGSERTEAVQAESMLGGRLKSA